MLILSRKIGDTIVIGDVKIKIIAVQGNIVRVGTEAPKEVKVHHEGARKQIQDEKPSIEIKKEDNQPVEITQAS